MSNPKVGIVMGSDSDLKIMQDAVKVLREFDIESELVVASAHRTPYKALQYAETAEERTNQCNGFAGGRCAVRYGSNAIGHSSGYCCHQRR